VFVMPVEGGTPVQVTTGADDHAVPQWSPDGRRLLLLANLALSNPRLEVGYAPRRWRVVGPAPLPLVVGSDTMQPGIGAWSPDGRLIASLSRAGLVVLPAAGGAGRLLVPAPSPTFTAWSAPPLQWSPDSRLIYYFTADSAGVRGLSAVPATGGVGRVVVRFDDPLAPGIATDSSCTEDNSTSRWATCRATSG